MATSLSDVIDNNLDEFKKQLFTAIPATITSVENYSSNSTISAQPTIQMVETDLSYDLPPIEDIPVQFPSGGGAIMSFPLEVGDDVLLIFSMRSIDDWGVSNEGIVKPSLNHFHDLSDAIAIPCIFRDNNSLSPSSEHVEIKWGDTVIRITSDKNIELVTGETLSIQNSSFELISLLSDLIQEIENITVTTVYGPTPINNLTSFTTLRTTLDTMKE